MIRHSKTVLAAAFAVSAFSAIATSASAQDRIEVGVLECRGSNVSFLVGSVTELGCGFRPAGGGPVEPYHATLRRAGVDLGFNSSVVVAWAVWAPSRGSPRFDLSGNYGGAAASATIGVGVGANALIGGSGNTIALQPVSGQAQTGLSVAAGVAGLELRAGR
jgi:Protein of unknown function (DUF992)